LHQSRLADKQAGEQGQRGEGRGGMGRGCPWWSRVAAPPSLPLQTVTDGCLDRDATRPWHTPVLSLIQHSARELSALCWTDKVAPIHTPLRS